ncbi:MAG: pentapeptide repeat-containing protein [Planctomycetales bacterium]|nr:pentapeptide repeat-containing protein [Planctomycetales bacterium]
MTLVAIGFAWQLSLKNLRRDNARLTRRLDEMALNFQVAQQRADFHVDSHTQRYWESDAPSMGSFSSPDLKIEVSKEIGAFRGFAFDKQDLTGVAISAGNSAFQGTTFRHCKLCDAKLVGGRASFQYAIFSDADLSGALLDGDLQGMSIANADCTGATIRGLLKRVDIDGAQFGDADLSAVSAENLNSCYFFKPPTYNRNTKFPPDFNPESQGWRRVL